MTMMNVNTQGWRDYITDQYVTQKDTFGFDGTHIDTLGQTVKKDASGNSVDLTDGLTALVNETASKTSTATGINLPDGAGTDKIGPSSASYIYTELWDHNETNQQVASYLQGARDKSANKPQIVAAYAGDFYQGDDAVTFTIDAGQGGTVTLVTRYARQDDDPAYHQMILDMGQPTQKLIKYVHFDATGSYDTWKEMTETVELTPGVHTISFWVPGDQTYTPVNIDCITSREFNSDSIKLADAAFAANGAHHLRILPFDNTSVTYHLEEGEAVTGQVRNDLGQCLTIPGDTTQEGTQAVISQCSSSSPSQRWSLPSPTGK